MAKKTKRPAARAAKKPPPKKATRTQADAQYKKDRAAIRGEGVIPICPECNSEDIQPVMRESVVIAYHCRKCGFNNRRTQNVVQVNH